MVDSTVIVGLEIASSAAGLIGSLVLVVSAWRVVPIKTILDKAAALDPQGPAAKLRAALISKSEQELVSINQVERSYLIWGTVLLTLSFLLSILAKTA